MRNGDIVIGLLFVFILAMIVGLAYGVSKDPTRSEDGSERFGLRDWLRVLPLLQHPGALLVYLGTFFQYTWLGRQAYCGCFGLKLRKTIPARVRDGSL